MQQGRKTILNSTSKLVKIPGKHFWLATRFAKDVRCWERKCRSEKKKRIELISVASSLALLRNDFSLVAFEQAGNPLIYFTLVFLLILTSGNPVILKKSKIQLVQ